MKKIFYFKTGYNTIFVLIIILNFTFQFTFLDLLTKNVLAQDYYTILQNIIDTDDESQLLSIVEKWQKSNDENASLFVGIAYHNLALLDSEKYSKLSIEWLEKYKGSKFTYICMAYKGSAITLIANALSKKKDFIGASAKLNEGFKLLDKAVNLDPENIIIRFLRSENGMEITESTPFNRSKEVEQDLNFLSTKLTSLTSLSRAQYYLLLGRLKIYQKKIAEAIAALKMVIKEAPDSKYAKRARQLLA
ncbi:MAG: tetratricopeptide repeat protein, partial [Exilispira sp.]